ncbi:Tolloid-like protein 2 [Geodia barretti]|uniref:Tolloid-like protein 2 n=1 Tax=Geodia barretti TaxID=519541 RepID=A0AA35T5X7_GEOBA|nr:Tolloid-like protein 2 [Geodia barretti]
MEVSCHCREGFRLDSDQTTCTDIDECSERRHNCQSGCSNTDGSFVCTCPDGYMLTSDGRTCKCGGVFTDASGSFSTPNWPVRYPNENFECEWMVSLLNPEATILFTIDDTAYGINGRSPCPTDHVQFFDGMGNDAASMGKLCKFDRPSDPLVTSTSEGKVIFRGSRQSTRPVSRVGVMVHYTTVMPITAPPPTTTATTNPPTTTGSTNPPTTTGSTNPPTTTGSTNPPTTTGSTNPPTTTGSTNPPTTTGSTNPPTTTGSTNPPTTTGSTNPPTTTATTNPPTTTGSTNPPTTTGSTNPPTTTATTNPPTTNPTTEAITTPPPVNECLKKNGGCQHECIDTPTSHYCSCRPGYSLDSDHRTCNIDCGGELTGPSGSFQTPDWPERYPQANFRCVWRITRPDSSRLIRFTVDSNHFGINGRNPCTDYLQFFRGSSQSNPVGDKLCFLRPPTDPIEITSTEATIEFTGSYNKNRPASRVGIKVYYEIV